MHIYNNFYSIHLLRIYQKDVNLSSLAPWDWIRGRHGLVNGDTNSFKEAILCEEGDYGYMIEVLSQVSLDKVVEDIRGRNQLRWGHDIEGRSW